MYKLAVCVLLTRLTPFFTPPDQPSKAASIHLTRTMANSLADKFVLVNAICPGVFPSRMTSYALTENKDILEGVQPTGRVGLPEDIAGLTLLLCSRAGSHFVGQAVSSLVCFLARDRAYIAALLDRSPSMEDRPFSSCLVFESCVDPRFTSRTLHGHASGTE